MVSTTNTGREVLTLDQPVANPIVIRMRSIIAARRAERAMGIVALELATADSHRAARRKMHRRIDLMSQRPTNRVRSGKVFG